MEKHTRQHPKSRVTASSLTLQAFLLLAMAAFLLPMAWMVSTGLKPLEQTLKNPPEWLPRTWTATLTRSFSIDDQGLRHEISNPKPERMAVVRIRNLEDSEALVMAGHSLGNDQLNVLVGQHMLVKLADIRVEGGEWGQRCALGPAAMRYKIGAESEYRLFECKVQEIYKTGMCLVRESTPDMQKATQMAGSGEDAAYAWGCVQENDLQESIQPMWKNVKVSLNKMDFWSMLRNTLWVSLLGMVGTTVVSALVAYGFAFGTFSSKKLLFGLTLATMMVPFPATMVPLYELYRHLDWIGTFKPLWVHCWFGAAFNIFLLRQFFMGLPRDLLDAARIDGCDELGIFWYVVVPLSKPALAMVAMFHFLYSWKDFMGPLLYLTDKSQFTLSLGLQQFQSQQGGTPWHLVMAAATVFALPLIVLFLITMKTFIRGIAMTGIKG